LNRPNQFERNITNLNIQKLLTYIKQKSILFEFIKYFFVGGIAFLLDFGTLFVAKEYLLSDLFGYKLYVAVTLGFIVGFITNYILSFVMVFNSKEQRNKSTSITTVVGFLTVGLIGLGLNYLGMYIGVDILGLNYMIIKIIITVIVLMWNYFGRKILLIIKKS
jgi:putative flippase GtrA